MSTMRELLLRVQVDAAFADLVRADPDAAIAGYELTVAQAAVIRDPGPRLYRYLDPSFQVAAALSLDAGPDPDPDPPEPEPNILPAMTSPDTTLPDLSSLTVPHPLVQPPDEGRLVVVQPEVDEAKRAELATEILAATGAERVAKLTELMGYVG